MNYLDDNRRLADLEMFDAQVFIGDDKTPQRVCDFVLALSLVFNDLRDLVVVQKAIRTLRPTARTVSTEWGEFAGMHAHWIRGLAGILGELARVVKENQATMEEAVFKKAVKQLGRTYLEAWQSTVDAAKATTPQGDRFGRMIYFARNKVFSHYDLKELARGYRSYFIDKAASAPYVSRDDDMAGTRFFFADAAAEEYLMQAASAKDAQEFFDTGWKILPEIAHALREIVLGFVTARGFAWRSAAT